MTSESGQGRAERVRLVLVHGTRMSARQWRPYTTLLPGIEVVAVDLPGHGRRVDEEFSLQAAIAVIGEAVDAAAPGQPVVLAGHSLGGYMAAAFAQTRPHALAGLVLLGATADPSGPLTASYRGFARVLPLVGHERMARGVNAIMRGLGARGEHADALPDGAAYAALPAAWAAVMDGCGPAQLEQVSAPVWLVNGQWDQMRVHVRRYALACREVRVVTIPRATHLMPATHPEQIAQVLRAAVARVEASDAAGGAPRSA